MSNFLLLLYRSFKRSSESYRRFSFTALFICFLHYLQPFLLCYLISISPAICGNRKLEGTIIGPRQEIPDILLETTA